MPKLADQAAATCSWCPSKQATPSEHEGHVRTTPHVDGQWGLRTDRGEWYALSTLRLVVERVRRHCEKVARQLASSCVMQTLGGSDSVRTRK